MSSYKNIENKALHIGINGLTNEQMNQVIYDILSQPPAPRKMTVGGAILLYLSDEEFIDIIKNGSENYKFISGSEVYNKIQERIKKLIPDG